MKALILCGGRGTRIRDVSELLPKPMLPIGSQPVLWHIMKLYAHHGIKDFVLCLGYKGWKIKEFFMFYKTMLSDFTVSLAADTMEFHNEPEELHWKVTLLETGDNAQTGARVFKARKHLENDDSFCVTYGDGVSNVNIEELVNFHHNCGTVGTVTGVRPLGRFGEIEMNGSLAAEFNEKPNVSSGWVNGGYMVFNNNVWDYFQDGDDLTLETGPIPKMVREQQLSVFTHDGFWQCMDTVREYEILNGLWARGEAPWKVWK